MNPWWINFFSTLRSKIPIGLCPSCGSFIRSGDGKLDPQHVLCDRCYKDFSKIKLPRGRKKGS